VAALGVTDRIDTKINRLWLFICTY